MSTRRSPSAGKRRATPATPEPPPPMAMADAPGLIAPLQAGDDLPRQRMAATLRSACALFRGFEAMRSIQLDAAHQALARHEAMARKLAQGGPATDLPQLQAELLRDDLQEAMRYWQDLSAAALDMQRELLGGLAQEATQEAEEAAAAIPRVPSPLAMAAAAMRPAPMAKPEAEAAHPLAREPRRIRTSG